MSDATALHARAEALHLHGLLAHWSEVASSGRVATLLKWEEQGRRRRSLERRLKDAHIGRLTPLCDFDWKWPKRCDRAAIEALMALDFLKDATNVVPIGPNGVGKSTLTQNIAHQALIEGHTALFTSAGQLLGDLCALDSDAALRRRLRHYTRPQLLVIDEVGYLSYSNCHADPMFELICRRYQVRSTSITTNRPFAEWREVFLNAACVVSLIDFGQLRSSPTWKRAVHRKTHRPWLARKPTHHQTLNDRAGDEITLGEVESDQHLNRRRHSSTVRSRTRQSVDVEGLNQFA